MRLTKDELTTLSKLLDEALDLPEADRDTWLERLADQYAALRPTLRELLMCHANVETGDFLKTLPKLTHNDAAAKMDSALQPGTIVGSYRLLRGIGHGGMSSVWLAERIDGVIKRSVALKLPFVQAHRSHYAERFIRECDILAGLSHPNIAHLYDAGVSALGQPFLAMEYIKGVPFIEHCDTQRLDVRARLRLFMQVLAAVEYAHMQLVVHRDLKPSNILVTAQHQVALLDFGIATLMVDGEAKETELTQYYSRALTPNYASPEQIAGQSLSTASDIYSLGVVLYSLLTGALPYKIKRDSRGALEDAILRTDPLKPSQVIEPIAARNRSSTPQRLANLLSGDLDAIVLKALKKSATERYATAQAFAADIERYNTNQPVLAQPNTVIYRVRKFLRRNQLVVGAVSGIVAALAISSSVTVWQARVARQQAEVAQSETHKAKAVQDFLRSIFQTHTEKQKKTAKTRLAVTRQLLDLGAKQVNEALQSNPDSHQEVLATLANMYSDLGLVAEAAQLERERIEVLKTIYGPRHEAVAAALIVYTTSLHAANRDDLILPALNEAKAILDAHPDANPQLRRELYLRYAHRYEVLSYDKMIAYADKAAQLLKGIKSTERIDLNPPLRPVAGARALRGGYESAEAM